MRTVTTRQILEKFPDYKVQVGGKISHEKLMNAEWISKKELKFVIQELKDLGFNDPKHQYARVIIEALEESTQ